jgi:hypothetical protein
VPPKEKPTFLSSLVWNSDPSNLSLCASLMTGTVLLCPATGWDGVSRISTPISLYWPWTIILQIPVSQVARTVDVIHWPRAQALLLNLKKSSLHHRSCLWSLYPLAWSNYLKSDTKKTSVLS